MGRPAGPEAGSFDTAATAVALVTRAAIASDAPRAGVIGDSDPADVLVAVEGMTAGLLAAVWPQDRGAAVLERMGLILAALNDGGGNG